MVINFDLRCPKCGKLTLKFQNVESVNVDGVENKPTLEAMQVFLKRSMKDATFKCGRCHFSGAVLQLTVAEVVD